MALVHETLYRSTDLARIDMAEYIRTEVGYLVGAFQGNAVRTDLRAGVHVAVRVDPVSLEIDQAIPCGLIINELVSNALKYAFPDFRSLSGDQTAKIRVELSAHDGDLALVVADNGVGFAGDIDWQDLPSLGLRLVHILTEQVGGTIEMNRNGGTTFVIVFPEHRP